MAVRFHPHAKIRMAERGATEDEVRSTVEHGENFPAKFSRTGFRQNFSFEDNWHGRYYNTKQIEAFAVKEDDDWLVITVITRYFSSTNGDEA